MSEGVWLFARGTLKAHYVKDNNVALCGRDNLQWDIPQYPVLNLEKYKCKACQKALKKQGDGTK